MPLIRVSTSVKCDDTQKENLAKDLSKITAEGIGKPETYVQAIVEDGAAFVMAGEAVSAAFVEIKSIGGLNSNVNNNLSEAICSKLELDLNIPPDKTYINFIDVSACDWGWNSSTFG